MSEVYQFDYRSKRSPAMSVQEDNQSTLAASVKKEVTDFFNAMEGQCVDGVYKMVLAEVEVPLLEAVLKKTANNQSKSAEILGLNRGTLRKKLKNYGML